MPRQVAVQRAALVEAEPQCSIEEPPPLAHVAVEGLEGGAVALVGNARLTLSVTNDGDVGLTVSLRVISTSELGRTGEALPALVVPAAATTRLEVDKGSLGLPAGHLDWSGILRIVGRATGRGSRGRVDGLRLHFHPVDDGWSLYTDSAWADRFDSGALTPAAREARDRIIEDLPAGARVPELVGVRLTHVSDDSEYREPEATGDRDGEEGGQ